MTARSEILEAARYLSAQGRAPFSPKDLIAELRSRGCRYPDSTLRAHIVGAMCVNSPDNHPVQYDDLRRVGHGQYVLAGTDPGAASVASPPSPASVRPERRPFPLSSDGDAELAAPAREWDWEGHVQQVIATHLSERGWQIVATADTASREAGADILARRGRHDLIVEVKGYPRTGKASAPTQARHYTAGALLTALLAWADHPHASVLLAFPDARTYRNLARRLRVVLEELRLSWWFVHEDGRVERWLDLTEPEPVGER